MGNDEASAVVAAVKAMGEQIGSQVAGVNMRLDTMVESVSGVRERIGGIDEKLKSHDREFKDLKTGMKANCDSIADMRSWVPDKIEGEIKDHREECERTQAKVAEATGVAKTQVVELKPEQHRSSGFFHRTGLIRWLLYIGLVLGAAAAGAGVTITIGGAGDSTEPTIKVHPRNSDSAAGSSSGDRDRVESGHLTLRERPG